MIKLEQINQLKIKLFPDPEGEVEIDLSSKPFEILKSNPLDLNYQPLIKDGVISTR